MGDPISRGGQLQDFIPRPGDSLPSHTTQNSKRQKWGGREFISNYRAENNGGVRQQVTLIETGSFPEPRPINLQIRFAATTTPQATALVSYVPGQPVLPFVYSPPGTVTRATVEVRRGVSGDASPTIDTYVLNVGDVLTVDNITCTQLSVSVQATGIPAGGAQVGVDDSRFWIEALACPVDNVGPKNLSYPYNVASNGGFRATNAAAVVLMPANSDRVQFYIVNTSTDADLLIQCGLGPNNTPPTWTPNPVGSFILPRGGFATYESQAPFCSKMAIYAIWSNAGTGGAMFSEGVIY